MSVSFEGRCKARVHGSEGWTHQCTRAAQRDGYCTQHHPDSIAKAKAARDEKFRIKHAARMAKWAQQQSAAEKQRELAASAPKLRAALETLLHDVQQRGYHISEHALWAAQEALKEEA